MNKQKILSIFLACFGIFIIMICVIMQAMIKDKNKDLDNLNEKYEDMTIKTKSGIEVSTQYTYVDDNNFYFKVPESFRELTYEEITNKYNGNVPNIVFSNEESTINIAVSLTDNKIKDAMISSYKKYMLDILKDNNEILSDELYLVDGHNVGRIVLINDASDTKIYNDMAFFSYKDNLVILTFNSTIELRDEWEEVGKFVIDSLFFKD